MSTSEIDWFEQDGEVDQLLFERGGVVDEDTFFGVLADVSSILTEASLPHLFMGGLASSWYGRPRWTHDIDIFLSPQHAAEALVHLAKEGYATQQTYPDWLFKAMKDEVLVDLIFRSKGDMHLDDEMLMRAVSGQFGEVEIPLIPPEDLVVMKAIVHDEPVPRHWYDALGIIRTTEMDWDYLKTKARFGAKRVLSLLIYAQSNDLIVPTNIILDLIEEVYSSSEGSA